MARVPADPELARPLVLQRPVPGAWRLLTAAVLAQATISVAEMGVPTMAPFLKEGLGLSAAGVGLLVACVNLGRIFGSLPAGRMVDGVGDYAVMLAGGTGVALFFGLAALSHSPWTVGAFLILAGVFAGSASPAGAKLVHGAFPAARRGMPMGIRQSAVPLGTLVAALMLPVIADRAGWNWALAVGGAVPLLGVLGVRVARRKSDGIASDETPAPRRLSVREIGQNRNVALATGWAMLIVGGQYAIVSYLILDLTSEVDVSLRRASLALATASFGGIVGRIAWGLVSDHVFGGRRKPPLVLMTLVGALAALLLVSVPDRPPLLFLLFVALIAGASLFGWQGVWVSLVSELAPAGTAGTTVGYCLTFVNVAIVGWPPLFGAVADAFGSYRASWLLLALAVAGSALLIPGIVEYGHEPESEGAAPGPERTTKTSHGA